MILYCKSINGFTIYSNLLPRLYTMLTVLTKANSLEKRGNSRLKYPKSISTNSMEVLNINYI